MPGGNARHFLLKGGNMSDNETEVYSLNTPYISNIVTQEIEGIPEKREIAITPEFIKTLRSFDLFYYNSNYSSYREIRHQFGDPYNTREEANDIIEQLAVEKYRKSPSKTVILDKTDADRFKQLLTEYVNDEKRRREIEKQNKKYIKLITEDWNEKHPDMKMKEYKIEAVIKEILPNELITDEDSHNKFINQAAQRLLDYNIQQLIDTHKQVDSKYEDLKNRFSNMNERVNYLKQLIYKLIVNFDIDLSAIATKLENQENHKLDEYDVDELTEIYNQFEDC